MVVLVQENPLVMLRVISRICNRFDPRFSQRLLGNLPPTIDKWTTCQSKIFDALMTPKLVKFPDVVLQSYTGSGKSLAYLLPLLEKHFMTDLRARAPQILVLVPTRELAFQVGQVVSDLLNNIADSKSFTTLCGSQIPSNWTESVLVVATPGALLRAIDETDSPLSKIQSIVLDEFDRLFDFGFIPQIEKILSQTNRDANLMLVSATVPRDVQVLANRLVRPDAVTVLGESHISVPPQIAHTILRYDPLQFFPALIQVLNERKNQKGLVIFPTTKSLLYFYAIAKTVYPNLLALHGRMGHEKRQIVASKYRHAIKGTCLFATDVISRGLDFPDLDFVINIGLSGVDNPIEQYIHRSGRTGRNSNTSGESILMVGIDLDSDSKNVKSLMEKLPIFSEQNLPTLAPIPYVDPANPVYKYARHLSTKCLESLLLWHVERTRGKDKITIAKSVIDMVRSAGLPQPYVSHQVATKLALDRIPGLLLLKR